MVYHHKGYKLTKGHNSAIHLFFTQVGMDKAIGSLTVPLEKLREEVMVSRNSLS